MTTSATNTIAIDFGTSNTVITRWNPASKKPETIHLKAVALRQAQNPPLIPSLVYVENAAQNQVVIGQAVRDRGLDLSSDARFFRNFKRGIGSTGLGFMPALDGCPMSFEQVGEWFLHDLTTQLTAAGYLQSGSQLVLTVPVDSFETYRNWLGKVAESLPVEQIRLLDEPTAAALGYGMADREVLLVIDFGGGTLDLALVQLDRGSTGTTKPLGFLLKLGQRNLAKDSTQKPQIARVLAKAGQNLGGADIDQWLVAYFAKTQGLPDTSLAMRLAERLKIQLSLQTHATEVYFDDRTLESYDLMLSRQEFEDILRANEFFDCLDLCLSQVLQQAQAHDLTAEKIDAVLLVGGTCQIPAVKAWADQHFGSEKVRSTKPFEAIAEGALQLVNGLEVKDFLYHSYGIRYWDRRHNRHGWHPLIKTGQPYPMEKPVELILGASTEGQPSIELVIGELGTEISRTEVFFDGDRLVTRRLSADQMPIQPLNDQEGARTIARLEPPGYPGRDRVKVLLRVDGDRFLRITVEDLLTHEALLTDQVVVQLS